MRFKLPKGKVHFDSGIDELTHFELLGLGFVITISRLFFNMGAASDIYLEWKATPELLTSFANISLLCSVFTNCEMSSGGPEI